MESVSGGFKTGSDRARTGWGAGSFNIKTFSKKKRPPGGAKTSDTFEKLRTSITLNF